MFINRHVDNTLPLKFVGNKFSEWSEVGTWSFKLDDRMTVEIKLSCPEEVKLMAYEATFIIDNVPVGVDLALDWMPEFGKLGKIVCDELEKRVKEYSERKKTVVDNYIKWRGQEHLSNENTNS